MNTIENAIGDNLVGRVVTGQPVTTSIGRQQHAARFSSQTTQAKTG